MNRYFNNEKIISNCYDLKDLNNKKVTLRYFEQNGDEILVAIDEDNKIYVLQCGIKMEE